MRGLNVKHQLITGFNGLLESGAIYAGKQKDNKTVKITASIGYADSSDKPASPWDVVKLADQALYRAKGKGRNCISD